MNAPAVWCAVTAVLLVDVGLHAHPVRGVRCGNTAADAPAAVTPEMALCLLRSALVTEGHITAAMASAISPEMCGQDNVSAAATSFVASQDAAEGRLYAQQHGDGACLQLIWTSEALGPATDQIYLVGVSDWPEDVNATVYATTSNSIVLSNVSWSTLALGSIVVAVLSTNGSVEAVSSNATLLPEIPSGAEVHTAYFDSERNTAFRNLTWRRGNSAIGGAQEYALRFSGARDTLSTSDICRDWSIARHAGEVLQMHILTDLHYKCVYVVTIAPVVPALVAADLAGRSDVNTSLVYTFAMDFGRVNISSFDFVNGSALTADCHNALNAHVTFNSSLTFNRSSLAFEFGLSSFDTKLLLVPAADFFASLGVFLVRIVDITHSSIGEEVLSQEVNPYELDGNLHRAVVPNPKEFHAYRAEAKYSVHLAHYVSIYNPAFLPENSGLAGIQWRTFNCGPSFRVTIDHSAATATAVTSGGSLADQSTDPPAGTAMTDGTALGMPGTGSEEAAGDAAAKPGVVVAAVVTAAVALVLLGLAAGGVLLRRRRGRKQEPVKVKPLRPTRVSVESTMTFTTQLELEGAASRDDVYEVEPERLQLLDVVGAGAFGVVRKARLHATADWNEETSQLVAVKMLLEKGSESDRQDLLSEIDRMKEISHHQHIIDLVGCCTMADPVCLIAEWMPYGSLAQLLRETLRRERSGHSSAEKRSGRPFIEVTKGGFIYAGDVCSFGEQIASGMDHLSKLRYVHRDLAARNVLVGIDNRVKIADFGMTRDVYADPDEVYVKTSTGPAPLKWMAPESLILRQYTTQTDVWSFGVLIWEICTFAELPYANLPNSKLIQFLKEGNRLPCPPGCPTALNAIMRSCWAEAAEERPSFLELAASLTHLPDCLYDQLDAEEPISGLTSLSRPTFYFSGTSSDGDSSALSDNAYISGNSSMLMTSSDVSTGGYSGADTSASADSGYRLGLGLMAGAVTDTSFSDTSNGGHHLAPPPARRVRKRASVVQTSPIVQQQQHQQQQQQQQRPCSGADCDSKLDAHGYLPLATLQYDVQQLLSQATTASVEPGIPGWQDADVTDVSSHNPAVTIPFIVLPTSAGEVRNCLPNAAQNVAENGHATIYPDVRGAGSIHPMQAQLDAGGDPDETNAAPSPGENSLHVADLEAGDIYLAVDDVWDYTATSAIAGDAH